MNRRISAIKAERLKDLQLRLFPELPDDRRAAPNAVVRSSVFGVVRRGKRARVTEMQVAAPESWEIAITGWRLDQHDLDIWLEIMHAAGGSKPGEEVRPLHTLMKRLGTQAAGGRTTTIGSKLAFVNSRRQASRSRPGRSKGSPARSLRPSRSTTPRVRPSALRTRCSAPYSRTSLISTSSSVGLLAATNSRRLYMFFWLRTPCGMR